MTDQVVDVAYIGMIYGHVLPNKKTLTAVRRLLEGGFPVTNLGVHAVVNIDDTEVLTAGSLADAIMEVRRVVD